MKTLWLDDLRDPADYLDYVPSFYLWCKTAPQAIKALETMKFDIVDLDHDLGLVGSDGENPGDGYDVILWIENKVRIEGWDNPPIVRTHTSNPVAKDRMERAIQAIWSA